MANSPDNLRPDDADAAFHDPNAAAGSANAGGGDSNALEQLRRELEQANERCLRVQAEMENYRRRVQREMQDERRYASQALLGDLLPVMDNIERAIDAADQKGETSGLQEGVKIVQQQLLSMLEKHQCTRVPAAGMEFDPAIHEAIAQFPHPDHPAGFITHVSQHGYRLHDRVIRPAQVVVSAGPPQV
jgi:molecular chaperone GrpE